jgi:hypothetical protein
MMNLMRIMNYLIMKELCAPKNTLVLLDIYIYIKKCPQNNNKIMIDSPIKLSSFKNPKKIFTKLQK